VRQPLRDLKLSGGRPLVAFQGVGCFDFFSSAFPSAMERMVAWPWVYDEENIKLQPLQKREGPGTLKSKRSLNAEVSRVVAGDSDGSISTWSSM
jgi:hypothetical protein